MVTLEKVPARTLTLSRTIKAPIAQVYSAFTDRDAMTDWLADDARIRAAEGGHILLTWDGGRHAFGEYTTLEKEARVAFTMDEGQVEATFAAEGERTHLTVSLSGFDAEADVQRAEWKKRLDTLQLSLEDGADLRITGRVILGIYPSDFDAEIAKKLGIPTEHGVRVGNTIPGYSAAEAGLVTDDVVVGVNGEAISEQRNLGTLVKGNKPGDTVQVDFYRGGEKHTIPVTLKGYPAPDAVADFPTLADRIQATYAEIDKELAGLFEKKTEAQAAKKPAPKEWSANEVLAHLIMSERWLHNWLGTLMNTPEAEGWSANHVARITAVTTTYPTHDDLLAELRRGHAETVALVRHVPGDVQKNVLWWMNFELDGMAKHARQHLNQIEAALA